MKPSAYQYLSANKDYNKSKNRDSSLIPIESHRIALAPKPGIEGSDYINASWLNGHNKLKEFIVTQHPTTDTKEDFWRMLWDHNAQTVVLLSTCDSEVNMIRYSEQPSILEGYLYLITKVKTAQFVSFIWF